MEPPDKKRRTDHEEAAAGMWDDDDDLDQLLTQDNLNQIDNLILASQSAASNNVSNNSRDSAGSGFPSAGNHSGTRNGAVPVQQSSRAVVNRLSTVQGPSASVRLYKSGSTNQFNNSGTVSRSSSFSPLSMAGTVFSDGPRAAEGSNPVSGFQSSRIGVERGGDAMTRMTNTRSSSFDNLHSSATIGSGKISPALPDISAQMNQMELNRVTAECTYYKSELNKLKENQLAKDGQVSILREKLDQAKKELNEKSLEIVRITKQTSIEKSKKEADLETENEKLRTQLQFRQQEMMEMKTLLKKAERQTGDASDLVRSSKGLPKSPSFTNSPNIVRRNVVGGFPSSESFLAQNSTPSPHPISDISGHPACDSMKPQQQRMKLTVSQPNGFKSGRIVMSRLLQHQLVHESSHPSNFLSPPVSKKPLFTRSSTERSQKSDADTRSMFSSASHQSVEKLNTRKRPSVCLAHISIDALLTRGDSSSSGFCSSSVTDGTNSATLMLPLIEDVLEKFINVLQKQNKSQSSISTGALSGTSFSLRNTMESGSRIVSALSLANSCGSESEVVRNLCALYHLVSHCDSTRTALIGGGGGLGCSNKDAQKQDALVMLSISKIQRECRILDMLMHLANPVHTQSQRQCQLVPVLCLNILRVLIHSCTDETVNRFDPLLKSNALSNCLSSQGNTGACFVLAHSALQFVASAVRLRVVASGLCSFGDSCLLLSMISFCCEEKFPKSWTSDSVTSIHKQIVSILGSLIHLHFGGYQLLLSANCVCSSKLVRGLLCIICEQYYSYLATNSETSLLVLRQGMRILYLTASHDKTFVEKTLDIGDEFSVTLVSVRKLLRSLPQVLDHEVKDLWYILPELLHFGSFSREEEDMQGIDPEPNGDRSTASR